MSWQVLGVLGIAMIVAAFLEGGISITGVANISRAKSAVGAVVLVVAGVAVLGIGYVTWREKPPPAPEDSPGVVERIVDRVMSGIDDLAPSMSRPALVLTPSSGPRSATISLSGSGFDPGERVDIRLGVTVVASTTADDEGSFRDLPVGIPADAFCPSNQCTFIAQGKNSLRWIDAFYDIRG